MDRRTSLKWLLAAMAAGANGLPAAAAPRIAAKGYGTDPNLVKTYRSGELWPLTFTGTQRKAASALCATLIPADEHSPGADELEVHRFIDEWVSAPYPGHRRDRELVLEGLAWIDRESVRRFGKPFAALGGPQRRAICDDICDEKRAAPERRRAARFFARYRDLTADGFYTTPSGMKDLGFVGNAPSASFDGPPPEALRKAGLA